MIAVSRRYAVRYRLDGMEYTSTVRAWNEIEARQILLARLSSTLAALPDCTDCRVLSATLCPA